MGAAVAVSVGLAIAVQAAVLSRASTQLPALAVSLGLQLAGVLVAAIWATTTDGWTSVVRVTGSWWWIPLGTAGWLVVAALGFAAARLGVAPTLAIVVVTQLGAGLVLDAVTDATMPTGRQLAGVVVLGVGLLLVTNAGPT
jgi:transporter family-2 protein